MKEVSFNRMAVICVLCSIIVGFSGCSKKNSENLAEPVTVVENNISYAEMVSVHGIEESETMEEQPGNAIEDVGMTKVIFLPWEEAGLEDHVMDWQDENLEVAMREITGITDGDIMLSDVWEITELNLSVVNIPEKNSLEELDILQNSMLDNIKIVDISALGELTNLQQLDLAFHNVNNIDALGGLINLQNDNQISDISALGELENLRYLYIQDNPISDYSPLDGLSLDRLQKD